MGRLDVEQMLDELSWEQFCGWLADYEMGRWGEERADLRTGSVLSLYANAHRKKGAKPFKPADFVSMFSPQERAGRDAMNDPEAWDRMIGNYKAQINRASNKGSSRVH